MMTTTDERPSTSECPSWCNTPSHDEVELDDGRIRIMHARDERAEVGADLVRYDHRMPDGEVIEGEPRISVTAGGNFLVDPDTEDVPELTTDAAHALARRLLRSVSDATIDPDDRSTVETVPGTYLMGRRNGRNLPPAEVVENLSAHLGVAQRWSKDLAWARALRDVVSETLGVVDGWLARPEDGAREPCTIGADWCDHEEVIDGWFVRHSTSIAELNIGDPKDLTLTLYSTMYVDERDPDSADREVDPAEIGFCVTGAGHGEPPKRGDLIRVTPPELRSLAQAMLEAAEHAEKLDGAREASTDAA